MASISERLESLPMTRATWAILFLIGVGWMFDAMDQGMVAGVIASISDWGLDIYQKGLLTSSGLLGMIIGAALSGALSDRFGRRAVILYTLLIYSIGSFLCGLATEYWMLIVFRFLTGFGLGGELPAASTLVSEISPLESRGKNVIILESFWAWGWILSQLVAYLLIPVYGWRMAFIVGAVPALFAAFLRFKVPESPRFLEVNGRTEEADEIVSGLERAAGMEPRPYEPSEGAVEKRPWYSEFRMLWSRNNLRATVVLWVIWFGINFGYYGFVLWTPSMLVEHMELTKSLGFVLIMCVAQLPGYLSAALLVERIGRKPTLILFFMGTAAAAWLFGHSDTDMTILATGCLLYFFALGAWGCVYSYTPEVYPTDVRGSGTGWASAFGRVGAVLAPMVVPVLYSYYGSETGFMMVFAVLSAVFIMVAVVIAVLGKETKGIRLADRSQ
ncbi:MFS transporter [methanogenic archaeon mixed culture ISO4-G1]|nr:MFS transporter [methanogenic archaeon mixed culture ISO4-G1]